MKVCSKHEQAYETACPWCEPVSDGRTFAYLADMKPLPHRLTYEGRRDPFAGDDIVDALRYAARVPRDEACKAGQAGSVQALEKELETLAWLDRKAAAEPVYRREYLGAGESGPGLASAVSQMLGEVKRLRGK